MIHDDEMIHGLAARTRPVCRRRDRQTAHRSGRAAAAEMPTAAAVPSPPGEWDLMRREYQVAHPDAPVPAAIENETGIVPAAVARMVCDEAATWLGESLPGEWTSELVEHAEVVYHHNPRFRRLIRRPRNGGNAGLDWLQAFTRHWLQAILASRRPHLLSLIRNRPW